MGFISVADLVFEVHGVSPPDEHATGPFLGSRTFVLHPCRQLSGHIKPQTVSNRGRAAPTTIGHRHPRSIIRLNLSMRSPGPPDLLILSGLVLEHQDESSSGDSSITTLKQECLSLAGDHQATHIQRHHGWGCGKSANAVRVSLGSRSRLRANFLLLFNPYWLSTPWGFQPDAYAPIGHKTLEAKLELTPTASTGDTRPAGKDPR